MKENVMRNFKSFFILLLLTILAGLVFGHGQNYIAYEQQQDLVPLILIITDDETLVLNCRRQEITQDVRGRNVWKVINERKEIPANEVAIIICDMWHTHYCRGAAERVAEMAPRMNKVISAARKRGVTIIHAPSGTMKYYEGTPARERVKNAPHVEPPTPREHDDPPLPVDASEGGCDTTHDTEERTKVYIRQIETIEIDQERDCISDKGQEIYNFMQQKDIKHVIIMGVHTNMCILNRSFAIKQMVKWGVNIMLCRDLTDAMYNPEKPPYVSHEEGTRLVVEYIEKFWCPSVSSKDLGR